MAKKEGELKTFNDVVGSKPFYPDLPQRVLEDILDTQLEVDDAVVVRGFMSQYGRSDFALLLLKDLSDGSQFTTLCGGSVVVTKVADALEKAALPLLATISFIKAGEYQGYYDIN